MKNYFVRLSNQHENISKIVLIVITVLLIVIALPKETQFNYTFQKGKPWAFENLMAPFDFAINKTEAELNEEKATVMKNSHPFYRFDEKLAEQKIYLFKNELADVWNKRFRSAAKNYKEIEQQEKLQQVQETIGVQILKVIYEKGIILINDKTKSNNPDGIITIVKANIAEEHNLNDYYTIQTAFSFIQSQLENISSADQTLLAPLLENALSHNILYDDQATRQWTKQLIDKISLSHGLVQKDEVVVLKGEIIDDARFQKLESLRAEMKNQEFSSSARWMMLMGHFILVSLAMTMLVLFLFLFRKDIFDDNRRIVLLMLLIVMITYLFLWARKANLFDM